MGQKLYLSLLAVFCMITSIFGQFSFERNTYIPISVGGNLLSMPWAGGLNNAQFSEIDMDFDGRMDLFVFDRSDDQIRIFLSKDLGGSDRYIEAPEYRFSFPNDLSYRAALVDFNQDGMPDIFTYGIGGVKVYRNIGNATIGHQWTLEKSILRSQRGIINEILYVSSSDIPAYVDVDGDSDIDILTFHIGGDRLEYHKNNSMELYGIPDSLIFEVKNECWGNFRESTTDNDISLNNNIFPCGTAGGNVPNPEFSSESFDFSDENDRQERHAGSTVLALDYNNSGVLDLILGDIAYPNLVKLENGGSAPNTNSSMVAVDYFFPNNSTAASVTLFPAAFFVDADHDGIKDLVVTPNAKIVSENVKSVWRYKNTGTNELPNFIFQQDDFLQSEMVDLGSGTVPVLVDVNGDGLKDLVVANYYNYKATLDKESRLAYYRNTGTEENPQFTFISNNLFGLNNFELGLRILPTFGDLDGDGDLDMIVGNQSGRVHIFTNSAGAGNTMSFGTQQFNITDEDGTVINVGAFSAPQLVDLNRDGLLDLVIGNKNGVIFYYENVGTSSNAVFRFINDNLGGIDVDPNSPDGFSVPHFVDLNGAWHLFIGKRDGQMYYASGIEGNLLPGATFENNFPNFINFDLNSYSAFWIEDLNNNGFLELIVGNDLGGIELFEHDPNSTISIEEHTEPEQLKLYPNPFENTLFIAGIQESSKLIIYNVLGSKVFETVLNENDSKINTSHLPKGMYFVKISSKNVERSFKILKSKD